MDGWSANIEEELLDWYRLTPAQRWQQSSRLWDTFFLLGGTLDDQPDSQSPFRDAGLQGSLPSNGLRETRTPAILQELAARHPALMNEERQTRPLLAWAAGGSTPQLEHALLQEELQERQADCQHWEPLRRELEQFRHSPK